MQGPLAAVVLLLELTHHADALMVPVLLAVVEATVLARVLGAPSIYAARLAGQGEPAEKSRRLRGQARGYEWTEQDLEAPSDLLPASMPSETGETPS
jgi:hypothetical protein